MKMVTAVTVPVLVLLLVPMTTASLLTKMPQSCVTGAGQQCVFPFTYKGTQYFECTRSQHLILCTDKIILYLDLCRTDSYNSAAWCATAVDPGGNVVTNRCAIISTHVPTIHVSMARWGDCDPARCPVEAAGSCEAVGGPGLGQPCVFPFTVDGETHHQCKVLQLCHCIEEGFNCFY